MAYLFVSMVWGCVGLAFAIYGKKQGAMAPLFGGVVLMGLPYFIRSPLWLSVLSALLVAAIVRFRHLGN